MSRVDFSNAIAQQSQRYDDNFWQELIGKAGGRRGEAEIKKELGF